jgi:hypothetical protein
MRARTTILFVAMAALLSGGASAAEKPGKPLNVKPPVAKQSDEGWRERAMKARAEFEPDGAPASGNTRAVDERGERRDGEEAGGGRLREDRGEGGE